MNRNSGQYTLLVFALFMAILPFGEQPHLYQKILLLKDGYLHEFMDWFDLVMHGGPLVAVLSYFIIKLIHSRSKNT